MRRGRALPLLLALLAPAGAAAQGAGLGDAPSGPAAIRGRVVHPDDPARAAGVEVVLYSIDAAGAPGARQARADGEGRFAFEGVSNAPGVVYLVGARHAGIPFPGARVTFAPGEVEREVEVRVAEATRDPRGVAVPEATLRVEWLGGELAVSETHRLHNPGGRVVYAPPEARQRGARPAFRTQLPEGFRDFALPHALVPEGLVREGAELRFFGPVYPGEQELDFRYALPATAGETWLRRRLDAGAGRLRVLVAEGGPELRAPALREAPPEEREGRRFRVFEARGLAPGGVLELALVVPPARDDPGALALSHVRVFLELDDAALRVSEEHHLVVDGETPLVASAQPLLRVAIPAAARDLRFSAETLALGVRVEDGALTVRGPLAPGRSRLDLAYRLPAQPGATAFEREFDRSLPTLEAYVADTGVQVDSERLHRLRPVRSEDRVYLHFEAFHVGPEERVALRLTPLAARRGLPDAAAVAFVVGATALVAAFLVAPLLRGRAVDEAEAPEVSPARREREALYAALRDLDHDFETGKIADGDYALLRGELRGRAVALLREEERGARAPAEPPAPPACPACGSRVQAHHRFCAQCGRPLSREAGAPGREASG